MMPSTYMAALRVAALVTCMGGPALAQGRTPVIDDVIVVTATRTPINIADAPASLSIVTSDQIELSAAVDAMDVVRQTPGISFQGRGVSGRQTLSIRGMGSDQTLFMVDGRRTVASDNVFGHSNYQYNWLPINVIERIEVVRGPLSSLYGSEAMGGVVNIITREAGDAWRGSLAARFGYAEDGGNRQFAGLYGSGPLNEETDLLLSYTFNDQGDVPLATDTRLTEAEGRQSHNAYARLRIQTGENHRFTFDAAATTEDRYRDTNVRGRPPFHESSYDLDKVHAGASYSGVFGNVDVAVNAYHSQLEAVNRASAGVTATDPQTLKGDVLDGHFIWEPASGYRLLVGSEFRRETLVHPAASSGEASVDHGALFLQNEWDVRNNIRLTIGARLDDHEHFGSEMSPRLYAVFHINDKLSLKAGYGHGFRAPTIKQSAPEYRFIGPNSFLGNADVGPETSDNFEAGLAWRGDGLDFSLVAFANRVEDLITLDCISGCFGPVGGTYHYVNIAEAETRGLETELKFDLGQSLSMQVSHVYMESEDGNGRRLSERPMHTFGATLTWRIAEPGIDASLRAEHVGEQVDYARSGSVIDLPAYTLWHVHTAWAVNDRWQISAGVRNLTGIRLAEISPAYGSAEQGRTVYAGFQRSF